MKASQVAYASASSLADAFDMLNEAGDRGRILAGGQSLIAALNLRLDEDVALVDINFVAELSGIEDRGDHIHIGALTRHAELGASDLIAEYAPLLTRAVPLIAHAAIRSRGTIGGSLANADPAAELAACVVALGAEIVVASRDGKRRIPAEAFFAGVFDTDLEPGEILTGVSVPKLEAGETQAILELARRSGDYAIVGVAGVRRAGGTRLAYFGAGDTPMLASGAMAAIDGGKDLAAAIEALRGDLDPPSDANGTTRYRHHLAGVLLGRILDALGPAAEGRIAA